MERKFNVGDRVLIQTITRPDLNGQVATVTGYRTDKPWPHPIYLLSVDNDGRGFCETALRPIYDGNEKTSWSECAWQPNHLRVC